MAESKLRMQVRAFHQAFSVPVLTRPQVPADDRVRLRLRLVAEEFLEFVTACVDVSGYLEQQQLTAITMHLEHMIKGAPIAVDLAEACDAIGDTAYVLEGSAIEFGVDMGPVLDSIHASNMTKKGGERPGEKVVKGPNFVPPDIAGELKKQGWEG